MFYFETVDTASITSILMINSIFRSSFIEAVMAQGHKGVAVTVVGSILT